MKEPKDEFEPELYDCQDEGFDDRYFDGEALDADALFELWEIDLDDLEDLEDDATWARQEPTFTVLWWADVHVQRAYVRTHDGNGKTIRD